MIVFLLVICYSNSINKKGEKLVLIIDRIENDTAVCEDENGATSLIPCFRIHGAIEEGDVITPDCEGMYFVNKAETEKALKDAQARLDALFNANR